MTEQRIKELAEDFNDAWNGYPVAAINIIPFIRTVAAEARREGVEAMRDAFQRHCWPGGVVVRSKVVDGIAQQLLTESKEGE